MKDEGDHDLCKRSAAIKRDRSKRNKPILTNQNHNVDKERKNVQNIEKLAKEIGPIDDDKLTHLLSLEKEEVLELPNDELKMILKYFGIHAFVSIYQADQKFIDDISEKLSRDHQPQQPPPQQPQQAQQPPEEPRKEPPRVKVVERPRSPPEALKPIPINPNTANSQQIPSQHSSHRNEEPSVIILDEPIKQTGGAFQRQEEEPLPEVSTENSTQPVLTDTPSDLAVEISEDSLQNQEPPSVNLLGSIDQSRMTRESKELEGASPEHIGGLINDEFIVDKVYSNTDSLPNLEDSATPSVNIGSPINPKKRSKPLPTTSKFEKKKNNYMVNTSHNKRSKNVLEPSSGPSHRHKGSLNSQSIENAGKGPLRNNHSKDKFMQMKKVGSTPSTEPRTQLKNPDMLRSSMKPSTTGKGKKTAEKVKKGVTNTERYIQDLKRKRKMKRALGYTSNSFRPQEHKSRRSMNKPAAGKPKRKKTPKKIFAHQGTFKKLIARPKTPQMRKRGDRKGRLPKSPTSVDPDNLSPRSNISRTSKGSRGSRRVPGPFDKLKIIRSRSPKLGSKRTKKPRKSDADSVVTQQKSSKDGLRGSGYQKKNFDEFKGRIKDIKSKKEARKGFQRQKLSSPKISKLGIRGGTQATRGLKRIPSSRSKGSTKDKVVRNRQNLRFNNAETSMELYRKRKLRARGAAGKESSVSSKHSKHSKHDLRRSMHRKRVGTSPQGFRPRTQQGHEKSFQRQESSIEVKLNRPKLAGNGIGSRNSKNLYNKKARKTDNPNFYSMSKELKRQAQGGPGFKKGRNHKDFLRGSNFTNYSRTSASPKINKNRSKLGSQGRSAGKEKPGKHQNQHNLQNIAPPQKKIKGAGLSSGVVKNPKKRLRQSDSDMGKQKNEILRQSDFDTTAPKRYTSLRADGGEIELVVSNKQKMLEDKRLLTQSSHTSNNRGFTNPHPALKKQKSENSAQNVKNVKDGQPGRYRSPPPPAGTYIPKKKRGGTLGGPVPPKKYRATAEGVKTKAQQQKARSSLNKNNSQHQGSNTASITNSTLRGSNMVYRATNSIQETPDHKGIQLIRPGISNSKGSQNGGGLPPGGLNPSQFILSPSNEASLSLRGSSLSYQKQQALGSHKASFVNTQVNSPSQRYVQRKIVDYGQGGVPQNLSGKVQNKSSRGSYNDTFNTPNPPQQFELGSSGLPPAPGQAGAGSKVHYIPYLVNSGHGHSGAKMVPNFQKKSITPSVAADGNVEPISITATGPQMVDSALQGYYQSTTPVGLTDSVSDKNKIKQQQISQSGQIKSFDNSIKPGMTTSQGYLKTTGQPEIRRSNFVPPQPAPQKGAGPPPPAPGTNPGGSALPKGYHMLKVNEKAFNASRIRDSYNKNNGGQKLGQGPGTGSTRTLATATGSVFPGKPPAGQNPGNLIASPNASVLGVSGANLVGVQGVANPGDAQVINYSQFQQR